MAATKTSAPGGLAGVADQKLSFLLQSVGFTNEKVADLEKIFRDRCDQQPVMNIDQFTALLSDLGVPSDECERHFRAVDVDNSGNVDFREFIVAMAAMDPEASHNGEWAEQRARLIFRVYDANSNGLLEAHELAALLHAVKTGTPGEEVDSAIGNVPPQGMTEDEFVQKVARLQIKGTEKLLRLQSSVFHQLENQPHCLANDKRVACAYNSQSGAWVFCVGRDLLVDGRLQVLQVWLGKDLKRRAQFAGERNLVVSVVTDGNQSDFLMTDLNSGLAWDLTQTPFTLSESMSITVLEPPSMKVEGTPRSGGGGGSGRSTPANVAASELWVHKPSLDTAIPPTSPAPRGAGEQFANAQKSDLAAMSRWRLSSHSVVFSRENGKRMDTPSLSSLRAFSCVTSEMSHAVGSRNEFFVEHRRDIRDALDAMAELAAKGFRWTSSKKLHEMGNTLIELSAQCRDVVMQEPRLVHVTQPAYIVGDLHGNFQDLLAFESALWRLGPSLCPASLLFLGDYIDRRPYGFEVVLYLVVHKLIAPSKVVLLRGNHETREQNAKDGFQQECYDKFGGDLGARVWEAVNDFFDHLPIAAIVGDGIFCVHGGIPGPNWAHMPLVESMQTIPCPLRSYSSHELATDLMWSDPMETDTAELFTANTDRCVSVKFSTNALQSFLSLNNLQFVIRAHQYQVHLGFKVQKKNQLITVFSSSAYQNLKNQSSLVFACDGKIRLFSIDTLADKM
eukprot:CAMPEP_0114559718 /NCGR_PEP_ID=MMETSP0114-20121206/11070_1 /TAXON_ID=31324 /ORGANISM="Goniomonas sp, Strain m" /LENGTH=731 /DNA_ID=CAMNT_0001745205 /DNA_START=14 /DNA_END=2209 /DNA_ORIENTATION=-